MQSAWRAAALPGATLAALVAGLVARGVVGESLAHAIWFGGLGLTGAPVVWRTVRGMAAGRFAADLVAMLAIFTALLLAAPVPGLIVVLMQTGGEALERYAEGRASDAVRALEADAPRIAHRQGEAGLTDIPVEAIRLDDHLVVRPGEMIPCDARVLEGRSHVDASRLTGEAAPVGAGPGTALRSGAVNGEGALLVTATAIAAESLYARIVELVRSAEASKAPLQRMADRVAIWFTPLTLAVCVVAWMWSGDVMRVLAVLVVATPCPLILATPVAILGGINRAARRQIILRTGGALERLSRVRVVVFDKTGTITVGRPEVTDIAVEPGGSSVQLLHLAASVEQRSSHPLARSVVDAALAQGPLSGATEVHESPGQGVVGVVDGRRVAIGSLGFMREHLGARAAGLDGAGDGVALRAWVAVDGVLAGTVDFADRVRPGVTGHLARLRELGIERIVLLSGDREANVRAVARDTGIREAVADLLPDEKVARVAALVRESGGVVMVGDGTNDAPALARADVGIALAGHGGGIAAEAADAVILTDDVSRVGDAIAIARRTMHIARQSIFAGLGLSLAAMVAAALGFVPPVAGALLQEAIDVAVILNALRARGEG